MASLVSGRFVAWVRLVFVTSPSSYRVHGENPAESGQVTKQDKWIRSGADQLTRFFDPSMFLPHFYSIMRTSI